MDIGSKTSALLMSGADLQRARQIRKVILITRTRLGLLEEGAAVAAAAERRNLLGQLDGDELGLLGLQQLQPSVARQTLDRLLLQELNGVAVVGLVDLRQTLNQKRKRVNKNVLSI